VIDREALLERVDGDLDLLAELVETFEVECPRLLNATREAVAGADSHALERAAHSLKGSIGTFCAPAAFEAAGRLEQLGRDGDLTEAEAALTALEAEITQVQGALIAQKERV
jgi:HPt (histidine-containing phosphotransfer) domain-containing protein